MTIRVATPLVSGVGVAEGVATGVADTPAVELAVGAQVPLGPVVGVAGALGGGVAWAGLGALIQAVTDTRQRTTAPT